MKIVAIDRRTKNIMFKGELNVRTAKNVVDEYGDSCRIELRSDKYDD